MKTVLLRLSGFTVLPLLSLITPLLLLPIISAFVGTEGISSVISGQAIGTFASTVVMWGWNVEGPVAVARTADSKDRASIYLRSVRTRLVLLLGVLPLAGIAAALVAVPAFRSEAIAMAWATSLAGLSPAWFCIGMGQPKLLAVYDTVPRFLATAAAALVLLVSQQLWYFTAITAVASVISLTVFHRNYSPGGRWFPQDLKGTFGDLAGQRHTAGISLAGNAYASTPAPIATASTAPAASGSLATADTLYRFGLFTVVALGNAFQGWTLERGAIDRRKRHLAAIWAHAGLGIAGAVVLTLAGPFVSSILFAGKASATTELCFYYGVAFAFLSASTPFIRNVLIPAGQESVVLRWTCISAVLGVGAMIWAGVMDNAPGIALGMALSEAILFISLLLPARKLLMNERTDHVDAR